MTDRQQESRRETRQHTSADVAPELYEDKDELR